MTVFSEGTEELHGAGGGLPDYLLMQFGYPMDVVASHGDGVHQARVNLYRRGALNPQARGYWENKQWVIWVFAAREFTRAERWSTKVPVVPPAEELAKWPSEAPMEIVGCYQESVRNGCAGRPS